MSEEEKETEWNWGWQRSYKGSHKLFMTALSEQEKQLGRQTGSTFFA
jgi:hypothetical protein